MPAIQPFRDAVCHVHLERQLTSSLPRRVGEKWNRSGQRSSNSIQTVLPECGKANTSHGSLERLFLGLRTSRGVQLNSFEEEFGYDLRQTHQALIRILIEEGLLPSIFCCDVIRIRERMRNWKLHTERTPLFQVDGDCGEISPGLLHRKAH